MTARPRARHRAWQSVRLASLGLLCAAAAHAQTIPGSPGAAPQPIQITATQGIEWRQADHVVIATGSAQAVRGNVTVQADQLIAHYRKKAGATPTATTPTPSSPTDPESALDGGDNEIYELEAIGHVHIFTATDNAYGDHAVYDLDQAVLLLTGQHLKLTTPHDIITARDAIEYYSVKRQAIARGNALIVADDGRQIAADTLIGYLAPPTPPTTTPTTQPTPSTQPDMLGEAGKFQKVEAIGHVQINTPTEEATGDRGVYLPDQGLARLGGDVHIINGPNRLSGSDALVNTKTNVAQILAGPGGQVAGTVMPKSSGQ